MNRGYELIIKNLKESEVIIYQTDKNFKFGENNTIVNGEKVLYITNLGRIIISDKEKKFKGIKAVIYDFNIKNIKFKVLTKNDIIAINSRDFSADLTERFILNMKIDEFIKLYKKIEENPFNIEWNKYVLSINDKLYETAIIDLREDYVSFNTINNKENIYYKEISKCNFNNNSLEIELYSGENKFGIYSFNMPIKDLFKLIEDKIKYTEVATCEYESELEMNNKEIENDISKDNKTSNLENKVYKENQEVKNLKLNAFLKGIDYKEKDIDIKIDESFKIINKDTKLEILDLEFSGFLYLKSKDIFIINYQNNIISINGEVANLNNEKMCEWVIGEEILAYNEKFQSFLINIEYESINLIQSNENIIQTIELNDIADINILSSDFIFDKIAITLKNSTTIKLNIFNKCSVKFIRRVYLLKKSYLYKEVTTEYLYKEFLAVTSDKLKLYYFTDLFSIKNIIDDYYSKEYKSKSVLLNDLYSKIYSQKFILENISMYFMDGIKTFKNKELTHLGKIKINSFKEELFNLEKNLNFEFNSMLNELEGLDIFKGKNNFGVKKNVIISDFTKYLDEIGFSTEYLFTKEFIFYKEVSGFDFDMIIENIYNRINYFINFKLPYYIKKINELVNNLNYEVLNIKKNEDNKELKLVLFDIIMEFYVDKQYNSKSFNKYKIKKIIDRLNKADILNSNSNEKVFIDILD